MQLNVYLVAIAAATACGILSVKCALSFFAKETRLFMAVALMALAWLMLLPYYGELQGGKSPSSSSILLTAFGSYLFFVVAGLVARTAVGSPGVDVMDRYALTLLVPLASGSMPDLLSGLNMTETQFETLLSTSLAAVGYIRLWHAAKTLKPDPRAGRVLAVAAFVYAGLELVFLGFQLRNSVSSAMGATFVCSFAVSKVLLTCTLLYVLIKFLQPEKKIGDILGELIS